MLLANKHKRVMIQNTRTTCALLCTNVTTQTGNTSVEMFVVIHVTKQEVSSTFSDVALIPIQVFIQKFSLLFHQKQRQCWFPVFSSTARLLDVRLEVIRWSQMNNLSNVCTFECHTVFILYKHNPKLRLCAKWFKNLCLQIGSITTVKHFHQPESGKIWSTNWLCKLILEIWFEIQPKISTLFQVLAINYSPRKSLSLFAKFLK